MSEDLHALMQEAEDYFASRDYDLALERFQKVTQIDPFNEEACEKLARIFAIRGLISNVIAQYFQLMQILEDKGDLDLALEIAAWITQLQPENDRARLSQIGILKKKGQTDEVIRQSLHLARLYIELGLGDKSIDLLKEAQSVAPYNLDIGYELAEIYVSHGHITEGARQFREIANSFLQKEQYEKAADSFRRMKVIVPDDPGLLFTLGNIYVTLGRLNEAETEFRQILRHDLNHLDALMALGNVCQQKGQFRDAILAFNKILSTNPHETIAKEKLGELYHAQGSAVDAIKQYLAAAQAYSQVEEEQKSIRLYKRVLALDPTNPTASRELTNLGVAIEADEGEQIASAYAPHIAPVSGPPSHAAQAHRDTGASRHDEPERPGRTGRRKSEEPEASEPASPAASRPRAGKTRTTEPRGAAGLVPRGGSGGGKAMLPRPGLMSSARGRGSLIAKGESAGSSLKPRLGDAEGGGRTRLSDAGKPQLRRGQVLEVEEAPDVDVLPPEAETIEAPTFDPHFVEVPVLDHAAEQGYDAEDTDASQSPEIVAEPPSPVYSGAPEHAYEPAPDDGHEMHADASLTESDVTNPPARPEIVREVYDAPPVPDEVSESPAVTEESTRSRTGGGLVSRGTGSGRSLLSGGAKPRHSGLRGARSREEAVPEPVEAPVEDPVAEFPAESFIEGSPYAEEAVPTTEVSCVPEFHQAASVHAAGAEAPLRGSDTAAEADAAFVESVAAGDAVFEPEALLPTVGGSVELVAELFDGVRALEDLSRSMPVTRFAEDASSDAFETAKLEEYVGSGDMSRAILAFRALLGTGGADFTMQARLADALFVCGMVEEAAGEYLQLAHQEPENLAVLRRLVDTYLWGDTPDRAIDLLISLSYIHRAQGDTAAAFQALQDALAVQVDHTRARIEMATLCRQMELHDLASWNLRSLAQLADESGNGEGVVEAWKLLFEASGSAEDHEQFAVALEKYGRHDEAVEEYKRLAADARAASDVDRARALYERAAELRPSDLAVQEALVDIYQSSGDDAHAVDKMRLLGNAARHGGDLDTALKLYEDIVRREPGATEDRRVLVELYLEKGLSNNARNEAQGLLESWYRDNRFDHAIPLLQRFITTFPTDTLGREQLIHFYEKAGDSERALEERLSLARSHVARGASDDALKVYQKALSLDDRNAQVHYEMGVLYADQLGDPASAEQRFARVAQLEPKHVEAMRRLVRLGLALNRPTEAVQRLSELIRLVPENVSIREELVAEYRRRVVDHPDDVNARFTLGLLYSESEKVDDAIELFQETRKSHELFLQSCNMLGLCFLKRHVPGSEEAAIKWFRRGLETKGFPDEDYLSLRYNLAETLQRRSEHEEALALYKEIFLVDIHYRDVSERTRQIEDELRNGARRASGVARQA